MTSPDSITQLDVDFLKAEEYREYDQEIEINDKPGITPGKDDANEANEANEDKDSFDVQDDDIETNEQDGRASESVAWHCSYASTVDSERLTQWKRLKYSYVPPSDDRSGTKIKIHDYDPSKITLCIDLDETLVHSLVGGHLPNTRPSAIIYVKIADETRNGISWGGVKYPISIYHRPHMKEFLDYAIANFNVIIYSAGKSAYVTAAMKHIDPSGRIKNVFSRDKCIKVGTNAYVKNLEAFDCSLSRICLIDNSFMSYFYHPRNGIPINTWTDDYEDISLLTLRETLLPKLVRASNVYEILDIYNSIPTESIYDPQQKLLNYYGDNLETSDYSIR